MAESIDIKTSPPPSWLNADFVQTALRSGYKPDVTVESCDIKLEPSILGIASDIYHVTASLQDGEKCSVIVKTIAQAGSGSQMSELFHKEVKIINEILPEMEKLLQDVCPDELHNFGPKCYYHGNEPAPFIVLEDLRESGFNFARRHFGLDYAYCSKALETLARFHASSIAYFEQHPEEREHYCKHDFAERFRGVVDDFICGSVDCLVDEVKKWPAFNSFSEKLIRLKDSMIDKFAETLRVKEGSLNSLVHGDSMGLNLVYKIAENLTIPEARLVEFQTVVYGSPVIDVLHYVYACCNPRAHLLGFEFLIKNYHRTLQKTLQLLGYSDLCPSFEDFETLLNGFNIYAFYLSAVVIPLVVYDPTEEIEDENSGCTNLPQGVNPRMYKGKVYKAIMQLLLLRFEDQGLFIT